MVISIDDSVIESNGQRLGRGTVTWMLKCLSDGGGMDVS